jgi:2-dehydro-3-deoxy-D-arabinonate dehydratase
MMLLLCRYVTSRGNPRPGLLEDGERVVDLGAAGITSITSLLEDRDPPGAVLSVLNPSLPRLAREQVRLLAPVEQQEVWAAGVTYVRSRTARMEESDFSATAYDKVYEAERPELFFKSLAHKVAASGEPVGLRRDSRWTVPEPELALVLNSRGEIAGYTLGNDMSARDIEGENLLYLPQAKIYTGSCALGPAIAVGVVEEQVRQWTIELEIWRAGSLVFRGETSVGRIKRRFSELAAFLGRSQQFPFGAVLLTGTGIVPPGNFSLADGDQVIISVSEIGRLENSVAVV